jgi:SAM-dependent methyltransferase
MTTKSYKVLKKIEEMAEYDVGLGFKTAISRTGVSAPVKYLLGKNLLKGRILDYGAGRGDLVKFLGQMFPDAKQWDPHHFPRRPEGKFDTIYCGYVLNVRPPSSWSGILSDIKNYLAPGGTAYIAVRRDIGQEGVTKTGTEQYNVNLHLPVVTEKKGSFAIYKMKG